MSDESLYPHGRLGAPIAEPGAAQDVRHELIEALRAIRREGQEDLLGIERYDPDFSVKLSTCDSETAARAALEEWLHKRISVLEITRSRLFDAWASEVAKTTPSSS